MSVATEPREWILPSQAARSLGMSIGTLHKIAPGLGIRRRQIPGRLGRLYKRVDVDQVKARMEAAEAAEVAEARGETAELPRRTGRHRTKETARTR